MSRAIASAIPSGDRDAPSGAYGTARLLLWIGVLLPFVYTTAKNASDLSGGGSVGAMEIVRGGGPAVLLAISTLLAPTLRRGFGMPELFLATYAVVVLVSYLNPLNPSPQASLLKAMSLVSLYLVMMRLVRLYDSATDVVVSLTGLVHVILLSGAVQFALFKSAVYSVAPDSPDQFARLNLVIPSVSANPLAMLGVAGILSCALGVSPRWMPFNGVVRNALMLIYAYEIFLTRTRSALAVGLIIIAVSIFVRARRHPMASLVTGIVALAAGFLLASFFASQTHAFLERGQTSHGLNTLSGRTVIWSAAHEVWLQHQWLGLGYYTGHRLGIPGLSETQSNIDNTWLETLVDVGILGMIPLALFMLSGLWRLLRTKELLGDVRLWAVAVCLYAAAISFVNPTIQQAGPGCVLVGVVLLALGPKTSSSDDEPERVANGAGELPRIGAAGRWR